MDSTPNVMRTFHVLILLVLTVLVAAVVGRAVPHSIFLSSFVEHLLPRVIPAGSYARNLDSSDPDLVRESLAHLTSRKDPIAVPQAIPLLSSKDDYIWLNAAHYLGVCGKQEAVPYLIKALRHTAWRADAERVEILQALTGQSFGHDFARWQQWWLQQHPEAAPDWSSDLGHKPRLALVSAK